MKKIFLLFLLLFLTIPGFCFGLEVNYPQIPGAQAPQDFINSAPASEHPVLLLKYIFAATVFFSGIIFFGTLIFAGFKFLISRGNAQNIADARNMISSSFIGILLLLGSFLLITVINPKILLLEPLPDNPAGSTVPVHDQNFWNTTRFWTFLSSEIPLGYIIDVSIFDKKEINETRENRIEFIKKRGQEIVDQSFAVIDNSAKIKQAVYDCDTATINQYQAQNSNIARQIDDNRKKIDSQMSLIKTETGKLERAKTFLAGCVKDDVLLSFSQFLIWKDYLMSKNWPMNRFSYWDYIAPKSDYSTLFCLQSGSYFGSWEENPAKLKQTTVSDFKQVFPTNNISCSSEAAIGDTIERAVRVSKEMVSELDSVNMAAEDINIKLNDFQTNYTKCLEICKDPENGQRCVYEEMEKAFSELWGSQIFLKRVIKGNEEAGETDLTNIEINNTNLSENTGTYGAQAGFIYTARGTGYYPDNSPLEGGYYERCSSDAYPRPLRTLQDYLDTNGGSGYVSVAMDQRIKFGTPLRIKELEEYYNRQILFRVVDTGGAFKNRGTSRIDIATRNNSASQHRSINRNLTLIFNRDPMSPPLFRGCPSRNALPDDDGYIPGTPTPGSTPGTTPDATPTPTPSVPGPAPDVIYPETSLFYVLDELVPSILSDLENLVRRPLESCRISSPSKNLIEDPDYSNLMDCQTAIGASDEEGAPVISCCSDEEEFQYCYNMCFTEKNYTERKKCFGSCIADEAENLRQEGHATEAERIRNCEHSLNFYCCSR